MNQKYLIWSFQHRGWWKPAWNGYSDRIEDAGEYDYDVALKICLDANRYLDKNQFANEAMIPINEDFLIRKTIT